MPRQSRSEQSDRSAILIVGGYGQVGLAIARQLAPQFPGRVIVAGRSREKAGQAAAALGQDAKARKIDVFAPVAATSLDNVALVLMCLDQRDTKFVEQCLTLGIHYVDITANLDFLYALEKLDPIAKANAACAVLSVGVSPGLSNMLARRAVANAGPVERIDILLELGLGDAHGKAALEWMFDNLDRRFEVREAGQMQQVQSFAEARALRLPDQKNRPAYRFSFPDQVVVARSLDIASVSTWIRFESRMVTWLFALLSRLGLAGWLRRWGWLRRSLLWSFANIHIGTDICGVAINLTERADSGGQTKVIGIIGRREAEMTATIAAETARQVMTGELPGGVVHSDQVIGLDAVIAALMTQQPELAVRL
ncbi:MAG: hypothetical protein GXP03_03850 [Alphaproteobacteria bacterium]|nr:hypothetical protein [Alphaproteobacteria bacterium]